MSLHRAKPSSPTSCSSVRAIRSLRAEDVEKFVQIEAQVVGVRSLGGLLFCDISDGTAVIQTVVEPRLAEPKMLSLTLGSVVRIAGVVRRRARLKSASFCVADQLEIHSQTIEVLWRGPRRGVSHRISTQSACEELCCRLVEAGFVTFIFDAEENAYDRTDVPGSLARQFIAAAQQGHQGWFVRVPSGVIVGYIKVLSFDWSQLLLGLVDQDLRSKTADPCYETQDLAPLEYFEGEIDLTHYAIVRPYTEGNSCELPAEDTVAPIGWFRFAERRHAGRGRLVVKDLSSRNFPACTSEEAVLRGSIVELSARGEFLDSIATASPRREGDALHGIADVMERYGMSIPSAETALALLPDARYRLSRRPAAERFRLIWSILGNDSAAIALASSASLQQLRQLAAIGLITQFSQLTYLSPKSIAFLAAQPLDKRTLVTVRGWLSAQPTKFATFIETFAECGGNLCRDKVVAQMALSAGLVTPRLFASASQGTTPKLAERVHAARRASASTLLANEFNGFPSPDDLETMADVFPDRAAWHSEIAYSLFAPVTLTYSAMLHLANGLRDRSADFARSGIRFGGPHWKEDKGAYSFGRMLFFPSKNPLSIFAKASAGLCTSRDIALFEREDHLQLTAYDSDQAAVVGSVQLYVVHVGAARALLVRGINPSYRHRGSAKSFADAALEATRELARESDIPGAVLCEGLGLWSADSSDSAVRGYLSKVREQLPVVRLDAPVTLFTFRGCTVVSRSGTALPS